MNRNQLKNLLFAISIVTLFSCNTNVHQTFSLQANPQPLADENVTKQVDEIYNKMNQEERLAQLHSMYMDELFDGDTLNVEKCKKLIPNGVGHFSQYASNMIKEPNAVRDRMAQLQDWIVNNTPSGIPALFHEEVITGVTSLGETSYPQQIGLACSFNTELAELKTRQTSKQMRSIGGLLSLSPMVDVVRNPSFNRLEESYGEDGYLSAAMGVAFVRGLQGEDMSTGVAACSKHFLGYGGGGDADEKELMEEILMPHEAMIRVAGSKVLMPGYHAFHGTKCIASDELIKGILRDYVGFDGLVVSDYTAINQIFEGKPDLLKNVVSAINNTADVEFPRDDNYSHLQEAMDKGLVSKETFEKSVKRVLALKVRLGMFDKSKPLYSTEHIEFDTKEERQTAYDIATQSIVLLKNNGVLPLKNIKNIALTGPNANNVWAMLGDYTYQSMAYFWRDQPLAEGNVKVVTLNEGLISRLPKGVTLTYNRGCDWTEKVETRIAEGGDDRAGRDAYMANRRIDAGEVIDIDKTLKACKESDVIIAAVGENALLCGENRDRGSVRLPGAQEEFVGKLIATGKPVVLVMFGGRAQVISKIADKCAAIIQAWYPGEEGGNAVADILFGKVSPSAKLCVSYPNVETQGPICYLYSEKQDERVAYPFGYGLSYSKFEYSNLKIDKSAATTDEVINLSFDIKNTGDVKADEIAQIYLSPTTDKQNIRPIKLQGFGRTNLNPGETKTMKFIMSPQQFGYYADRQWNIAPGKFIIKVGASSQDIRLKDEITLTGEKTTMPLRTVYFSEQK